jgi:hypothetical protein
VLQGAVVGGGGLCLLAEKGVAGCSGRWGWIVFVGGEGCCRVQW